ncbi:metallophosphoesterase family protein [Brevibacillus dissolubilis]|uniref:metallophosphoesterase family protein n=1 Tax=Brevibacillus dissolubilis TaxID=1844116 RepID=UPI0011167570|nr:metallophosphoesterase [Brevibacillus dissolubilis]
MSILIMSDTHGLVREVKQVVERHQVDMILHCGDFCTDKSKEPFTAMKLVRGNCDTDRDVPEERTTHHGALTIYQTHGHLYGVKSSLLKLHYRGEETGANVVIFGHSHYPVCAEERGILFLNPGSLQLPRGFEVPTYAILTETKSDADSVDVTVTFYDHNGQVNPKRGGQFSLRR